MSNQSGKKYFSRPTSHRESMVRNLAVSLLVHKQIKTTLPKAKYLQRYIEPLITKAKNDPESLHVRRYLMKMLASNKEAIEILLKEVSPKSKTRPGGYTRVLKCGFRAGDAAPMAYMQLVDFIVCAD